MKRFIVLAILAISFAFSANAQKIVAGDEGLANQTVKEWNTDSKTKTRWLDRETTYDAQGRKTQEIEYSQYGQKWRRTYQYDANGRVTKDVEYDEKDKASSVRKYEYDSKGRLSKQYNYGANGKLKSTKVFEYILN